jgi:hypothetical protein
MDECLLGVGWGGGIYRQWGAVPCLMEAVVQWLEVAAGVPGLACNTKYLVDTSDSVLARYFNRTAT